MVDMSDQFRDIHPPVHHHNMGMMQGAGNAVEDNPHVFGGQGVLFDAPLGQPDSGTHRGNPNARLYRAISTDTSGTPDEILERISKSQNTDVPGKHEGLGLHWQHDLGVAQDYASDVYNIKGDNPMIIEAEHPGYEHVLHHGPKDMPVPHGVKTTGYKGHGEPVLDRLPHGQKHSQEAKDYVTYDNTVGEHEYANLMVTEVPIRPKAPMKVTAVLTPHPTRSGEFQRHEVNYRGTA